MADLSGNILNTSTSFNGEITKMPDLILIRDKYTRDGFKQQCAMTLFCNTSFDLTNDSPKTIAKRCVERAEILTKLFEKDFAKN